MMEFDLPILNVDAPIREAFAPMIDQGKSGLVCWGGNGARLVTFVELEKAMNAGGKTLGDVLRFDPALMMLDEDPVVSVPRLQSLSLKYGVLHQGVYTARVLSVSEMYAGAYLAAPRGVKCTHPATPHYYPPYKRDRVKPRECVVCHFQVP